jgi:hypothetical protein
MKSRPYLLTILLLSISTFAFAQHEAKNAAPPSEAQQSFDQLKALAGEWQGAVTLDPPHPEMSHGKPLHISMRVTSRGNALVHEMQEAGTPLDPAHYDHPVTTFYVDGDRLTLVHYCDAGNRPRMVARTSPDGKKIEFDFVDISGSTQYGHMHHAVFTAIDANHHTEDWTYMMPGDKPMHAHFDLQRANSENVSSARR